MIISKTFEVITEKSAAFGEAEDHGFIFKDKEFSVSDLIEDMGFVEYSNNPFTIEDLGKTGWFTSCDPELNYSTGAETYYSWHIESINEDEKFELFSNLKVGRLLDLVLKNRSLAENDPMNLITFDRRFQALFEVIGEERFKSFINGILDTFE